MHKNIADKLPGILQRLDSEYCEASDLTPSHCDSEYCEASDLTPSHSGCLVYSLYNIHPLRLHIMIFKR